VVRKVEDAPVHHERLVDAVGELTERTLYLDVIHLPLS
jgi:hypothetical protein